jgi:hypothetical protein
MVSGGRFMHPQNHSSNALWERVEKLWFCISRPPALLTCGRMKWAVTICQLANSLSPRSGGQLAALVEQTLRYFVVKIVTFAKQPISCFFLGHDFSRADNAAIRGRALALEGRFFRREAGICRSPKRVIFARWSGISTAAISQQNQRGL